MPQKKGSKRELIERRPGDKRYIRRDGTGQFSERQVDVGRSLSREEEHRDAHRAERTGRSRRPTEIQLMRQGLC